MMPELVRFFTVGCKVNQYETQGIRELFLKHGYNEASKNETPDIFVINTCSVTSKADQDSRRLIRSSHRENPNAKIIAAGCLTEKDELDICSIPGVTHIIKNSDKHKIVEILKSRKTSFNAFQKKAVELYTPLEISDFHGHSRAFIKIQDGCNNFCTYCKVPLIRGSSRTRDTESIIDESKRLINKGFKEIVLCGVCLGEWGRTSTSNLTLTDLLERIECIAGNFRIRLSSIEPNMVTAKLIQRIAESPKLCNHLHIPLQSGDDNVLKRMKRPYSARDYITLINRIKKTIPNFSLTTDILVGFPGESKRNFSNTKKLLKRIKPSRLHVFSYSKRKGTSSYNYESEISYNEKKQRTREIIELGKKLSYSYMKRFLNKTVRMLVEKKRDSLTQLLTGYTDEYIQSHIDGPDSLQGKLIQVNVIKVDSESNFFSSNRIP